MRHDHRLEWKPWKPARVDRVQKIVQIDLAE